MDTKKSRFAPQVLILVGNGWWHAEQRDKTANGTSAEWIENRPESGEKLARQVKWAYWPFTSCPFACGSKGGISCPGRTRSSTLKLWFFRVRENARWPRSFRMRKRCGPFVLLASWTNVPWR